MKAKRVFENIGFERSKDPHKSMGIGRGPEKHILQMEKILKSMGFEFEKIEEYVGRIKWKIYHPITEYSTEIVLYLPDILKSGEHGYTYINYIGFYPDPWGFLALLKKTLNSIIDNRLPKKNTELEILKTDIKNLRKLENDLYNVKIPGEYEG